MANMGHQVKYLCRIKKSFNGFNKGEERILPESVVKTFKNKLIILKKIKQRPEMITK